MKTTEQKVQEAFASLELPEEVRARALEAIEAQRDAAPQEQTQHDATLLEQAQRDAAPQEQAQHTAPSAARATLLKPESAKRTASLLPRKRRLPVLIAACLALSLIFAIPFAYAGETASAVIQENEAQITLGINRFGKVVSVRTQQEGANGHFDYEILRGKNYEEALDLLISDNLEEADPQQIDIDLTCKNETQGAQLEHKTRQCLQKHGCINSARNAASQENEDAAGDNPSSENEATGQDATEETAGQDATNGAAGQTAPNGAAGQNASNCDGSGKGSGEGYHFHYQHGRKS